MTPKTGAIRLATLRLFLPDGGCALSGLRSVRPAFNLASPPPPGGGGGAGGGGGGGCGGGGGGGGRRGLVS
ncbi:hypothetical protein FAS51_27175, partial [Klebsiella pneumoniae subsp. pneumoniae]